MSPPWMADVIWERQLVGGAHGFRWGRLGADYVGEWAELLVLRVDSAGRVVHRAPADGAPPGVVEKIANGEGAAFRRAIVGQLSLHASAVAFGPKAMVLLGESGAGKSTIAFQLCALHGGELLADDVAAVDAPSDRAVRVAPSERCLWLDEGSGVKAPIPARCARDPRDVLAFVALRFDEQSGRPLLRRRLGASALETLLGAILRFDPIPGTWEHEFRSIGGWAAVTPVWEIVRSRSVPPQDAAECLTRVLHPIVSEHP